MGFNLPTQHTTAPFEHQFNISFSGSAQSDLAIHDGPDTVSDGTLMSYKSPRFLVTLNAPSSMKQYGEHQITYLNRRQKYDITVVDMEPPRMGAQLTYYTSILVSFDEKPVGSPWAVWKSKYPSVSKGVELDSHASVVRRSETFDRFSVSWMNNESSVLPRCIIPLAFNFTSADFNLEGMRNDILRLCVKTQLIEPDVASPEISYCRVKLYRQYGAERQRKTESIRQLQEEIAQTDSVFQDSLSQNMMNEYQKFNIEDPTVLRLTQNMEDDPDGHTEPFCN
ncbi:hypothetical protein ACJ73_03564 [Blastomyces percursus]|uniref:Grh/CP2 DB domain-containing protein n=1 Tax=Blastomyces percursus TaxID=1658174 RepID=A0A1J9Q9C8_9EURO|nr:hypothetical protein ACJ73_03564 [Blastomyces percursus]